MKLIRCIITTLLLLFVVSNGAIETLAINTSFTTAPLTEDEMNTILGRLHYTLLTEEPQKKGIECFDINDKGMIAICSDGYGYKTVCIYSDSGAFLYGYCFNAYGSVGVEWDEDQLMIYYVRSDLVVSVDYTGEIKGIARIQNTTDNNSYWNKVLYSTSRKVGDTEYVLKNEKGLLNVFSSSYSQLVSVDVNGIKNVLYDASSTQLSKRATDLFIIFVLVSVSAAVVVWEFVKVKRGKKRCQ